MLEPTLHVSRRFTTLAILLGLASIPIASAQSPLPEKDRDAVVAKAKEKFKSLADAKNAAGKSYQSARVGDYAVEEGGQASVWATIRRNEDDRAVLELHKLQYRKEGSSWTENGDTVVQTVDQLKPGRLTDRAMAVNSFRLEHDLFSVQLEHARARSIFWGDQLSGMVVTGTGRLKFTPPDATEAFYLKRGVRDANPGRDNVMALDEVADEVQVLFSPDEAQRYAALLNLDKAPTRQDWKGDSAEGQTGKASFGLFNILVGTFEYEDSQYFPKPFEDAPGSFVIRAHTKDLGWLIYVVQTQEGVPIQLIREEKMAIGFGDPSRKLAPSVWCGYPLPEDRAGDKLAAEHRRPPKDLSVTRAIGDATIDESVSPTLSMNWRVQATAARNVFHSQFVLINSEDRKDLWTAVDIVLRDGKPQLTIPLNRFVHLVYFDPPLVNGDEVELAVRYRSTAMLVKLDDNFTYVQRGGWTPFVDILSEGAPMELTVNLPQKYTAMSFGKVMDDKVVGGMRTVKFFSEYPVNFPTIIYGQYNVEQDEVDGKPLKMYVAKSMRSIIRGGWGTDERGDLVNIPNIEVNRGKVDHARIEAKNAINVYQKLFGTPYPYPKLDLVSAPMDGASAQSPSGIIYVGNLFLISDASVNALAELGRKYMGQRDIRSSDWKGVVAHEVAHQWWGAQVNNYNFAHYWFVESLSEISAAIYLGITEGPKAYLEKVRSWKEGALAAGEDVSVQDCSWRAHTFTGYLGNVYKKGPYVFHMFSQLFGEQKLLEFMKNLATTYHGQQITTRDLQRTAERTVNVDLDWFFDQWVRGVGIPTLKYKADWSQNERGKWVVRLHLEQKIYSGEDEVPGKAFRLYVPVYVHTQTGKDIRLRLPVSEAVTDKSWEVPEEPASVTLLDSEETLAKVVRLP